MLKTRLAPATEKCGPHSEHRAYDGPRFDAASFERAASLFRAIGDPARIALLHRLDAGEACVSELAEDSGAKLSTLSQQLRVLLAERTVKRRREGKHIFYSLADDHVRELVRSALEHASEDQDVSKTPKEKALKT